MVGVCTFFLKVELTGGDDRRVRFEGECSQG